MWRNRIFDGLLEDLDLVFVVWRPRFLVSQHLQVVEATRATSAIWHWNSQIGYSWTQATTVHLSKRIRSGSLAGGQSFFVIFAIGNILHAELIIPQGSRKVWKMEYILRRIDIYYITFIQPFVLTSNSTFQLYSYLSRLIGLFAQKWHLCFTIRYVARRPFCMVNQWGTTVFEEMPMFWNGSQSDQSEPLISFAMLTVYFSLQMKMYDTFNISKWFYKTI